jgi:hypothetical protein
MDAIHDESQILEHDQEKGRHRDRENDHPRQYFGDRCILCRADAVSWPFSEQKGSAVAPKRGFRIRSPPRPPDRDQREP